MRVALVSPYAWDRPGGVQSHIRSLAAALSARGHEVKVFAPFSWRSRKFSRGSRTEVGVIPVGRSIGIPANGSVAPITFGPIAAFRIKGALSAFKPDVVHLHEPLIPSLSLLALTTTRAPTVGTFHAAAPSSPIYRAFRLLLSRANARLSTRTAVSEAAGRLVTRYFSNHLLSTPNGIDTALFADARPIELGTGQHVLFLGRLEPRKGPDVLVNAMGLLRDLDVTLVVAGEGSLRSRLEDTADRLQVKVRFLGEVSEEDKPRLYRSCEIYCAPNLRGESFGIVLVEALAGGCPVVCSDLDEFKTVAGPAAVFTPVGEPAPLAQAIRTLLQEPGRRDQMRSDGARRAQAFDWGRLVPTIESIYRQACSTREKRAGRAARGGHD